MRIARAASTHPIAFNLPATVRGSSTLVHGTLLIEINLSQIYVDNGSIITGLSQAKRGQGEGKAPAKTHPSVDTIYLVPFAPSNNFFLF